MLACVTNGKENIQTHNLFKTTRKVDSSETITATPKELTDVKPSRVRIIQNFHLVWLVGSIDEMHNDSYRNTITKLRQVVNTVSTFTDVDACIDFITDIKDDKIFMISAGELEQPMTTVIHDMSQVRAVYIFCENQAHQEQWVTQWPKVKGVFTDITLICEALKQAVHDCDQNSVSMSFLAPSNGGTTQNLDQLDQSFMYTQILKEILLTIDFKQEHFTNYLTFCREQFFNNTAELETIDKLEREYRTHAPIWWYTHHYLLYSMLNRALRTMEVDIIIKMGFFVRALHEHITQLHSEQDADRDHSTSFTLYRGQGISSTDFNQIVKTKGGLMSFNNFLSTSLDRAVSLAFAESNQNDPNLIGVLFQITIDPSISSTPFANICDVSYFQEEEEILFSMHSIFRIGQVTQIDNNPRLWQVDLMLTSDNDPQLRTLTECMREETRGPTGWHRLGQLMIKVSQFTTAEDLYELLLDQTADEAETGFIYYQLGRINCDRGQYTEAAALYEKSLEISQKTLPPNHPNLASSYNNMGLVYDKVGEYSKALSFHEKGLEIFQKTLPANHPDLAASYSNIGSVYNKLGAYAKALSSYEKSLEIRQSCLPPNHPNLASSYNNIGLVYGMMSEYSKALFCYEKSLEIKQKTLPTNHPDLASSYINIGEVYATKGKYSKALSYHEKGLEIRQKSLPPNHPDLATSYSNIGEVYASTGEYLSALSYHEKSLQIKQKTLPANHPVLAISYNNIAAMYMEMGEYSKAVLYCERALKIVEHSLPANHPNLQLYKKNLEYVEKKCGRCCFCGKENK